MIISNYPFVKDYKPVLTQIPLHNRCLIKLISQNGLFIIEKKKVSS